MHRARRVSVRFARCLAPAAGRLAPRGWPHGLAAPAPQPALGGRGIGDTWGIWDTGGHRGAPVPRCGDGGGGSAVATLGRLVIRVVTE